MSKRRKRGTLSSALLNVAKPRLASDQARQAVGLQSPDANPKPPAAIENSHAGTRAGPTDQTEPIENILFSKGAASAAAFRPDYWSYDRPEVLSPASETIFASESLPSSASLPAERPARHGAGRAIWLAIAASGCLALVLPALILTLSLLRHAEEPRVVPPSAIGSKAAAP